MQLSSMWLGYVARSPHCVLQGCCRGGLLAPQVIRILFVKTTPKQEIRVHKYKKVWLWCDMYFSDWLCDYYFHVRHACSQAWTIYFNFSFLFEPAVSMKSVMMFSNLSYGQMTGCSLIPICSLTFLAGHHKNCFCRVGAWHDTRILVTVGKIDGTFIQWWDLDNWIHVSLGFMTCCLSKWWLPCFVFFEWRVFNGF